ncbi:MAG TPA: hypothetical protein VGJ21_26060 [Terracidiphilus sp.]|jgi:hypothetical protein
MFEDVDIETQSEGKQEPSENRARTWWLGRWAHVLTMPVWAVLFMSSAEQPWGSYVSVAAAYTVLVFCLALGYAFKDLDDVTGNSRALISIAQLLIPHAFVLAVVVCGVYEWLHLAPSLPSWMTEEGRKGSAWYWCGMAPLGGAGYAEGFWMARRLRRRCPAPED